MIATEAKYVFMFKGKQHDVLKLISGEMGESVPVAAVVDINGGRVFILNTDYPELVNKDTTEVNASFSKHLFRIK